MEKLGGGVENALFDLAVREVGPNRLRIKIEPRTPDGLQVVRVLVVPDLLGSRVCFLLLGEEHDHLALHASGRVVASSSLMNAAMLAPLPIIMSLAL
jgi:hypothetical protein